MIIFLASIIMLPLLPVNLYVHSVVLSQFSIVFIVSLRNTPYSILFYSKIESGQKSSNFIKYGTETGNGHINSEMCIF